MSSKRIDNLDLMKAIGILMVISLHVPLWEPDFMSSYDASHVIQYFFRLISEGVPVFVTVNGFLLLKKNSLDIQKHLKKMCRILALLVLWGGVLAIVGLALDTGRTGFDVGDVIYAILNIQMGAAYTGVLWFLQNLLAVYLIFPVLWYLYHEKEKIYSYFFWIVSLFVPGLSTIGLLRDVLATIGDVSLLNCILDFLYRFNPIGNGWYLFYFMLGGMLWKYLPSIKEKRRVLGILGLLSWLIAGVLGFYLSRKNGITYNPAFNYGSLFMICFLVGFFALTLPYTSGNFLKKGISSIGQHTFGMYVSHFLFIFLLNHYHAPLGLKERLAAYVVVCISSYLFSVIVERIPVLRESIRC